MLQCFGAAVLGYYGAAMRWCVDAAALQSYGAAVLPHHSAVMLKQSNVMAL
jgi:hypothetical protein